MAAKPNRQLYIVDLVTLLLMVLIVAMQTFKEEEGIGPGRLQAFVFKFEVTSAESDTPGIASPSIGVSFTLGKEETVVSPGKGAIKTPEVEIIDPNGRNIFMQVYASTAQLENDGASISIFPRNLGNLASAELRVQVSYLSPEASARGDGPAWIPVQQARENGDAEQIVLARDGAIGVDSLVSIDLTGMTEESTPSWRYVQWQ